MLFYRCYILLDVIKMTFGKYMFSSEKLAAQHSDFIHQFNWQITSLVFGGKFRQSLLKY